MRQVFICFLVVLSALFVHGQDQPIHSRIFTPQELKDDVDSLYRIVTSNHPDLWKYADKRTTDRKWEEVKASIQEPMTRWEFIRYIAPLLNQYQDGHTNISYDFDYPEVEALINRKGTWFPYQVVVNHGELRIVGEYGSGVSDLSGQKILSINGITANKILDTLVSVISGDYQENVEANTGRLFPFFLWAVFGWEKDYRIRISHNSGRIEEFSKPGISPDVYFSAAFPKNDWTMQVFEHESLAIVECRSYRNEKAARKFIDSAFTVIRERKIRKLAFDIRRNGGGNSAIGDYFLAYLTDSAFSDVVSKTICDGELLSRFKAGSWMNKMLVSFRAEGRKNGRLYTKEFTRKAPAAVSHPENKFSGEFFLLTGPATYSSAHMTALAVKCYGLGKVIGQPTGERLDLTGESIGFMLPNTGLNGYCATAVYKAACGDSRQFGVQPDVFISNDQQAFQSGTDPVIAFLKKTETGKAKSLTK